MSKMETSNLTIETLNAMFAAKEVFDELQAQ